jgi:hypothetical protein
MLRKGFVERQIELLGMLLARLLFQKNIKDYEAALDEIDAASRKFVGMDTHLLVSLADRSLLALLIDGDPPEPLKALLAGALLDEQGQIYELQGRREVSVASYRKALLLLLEAIRQQPALLSRDFQVRIDTLLEKVEIAALPAFTLQGVFHYQEVAGRYDKAEDALFHLREIGMDDWPAEATAFYGRLLLLSDDALEAGGLPREEVNAGLREAEPSAQA